MHSAQISIVIPTYRREQVLLDTLQYLFDQNEVPGEILVVDQTEVHEKTTELRLAAWHGEGKIAWIRRSPPSIPQAMNAGLHAASGDVVLFLDDDIVPGPGLVTAHAECYSDPTVLGVVGQVLQPGQVPVTAEEYASGTGIWRDLDFPFNSAAPTEVCNCMAGNLSVRREIAQAIGGFDENFVGDAYRFETEFCRRLRRTGGRLLFEPRASLCHLRSGRGGTRAYGAHLRSANPHHSVGEYYFALKEARGLERVRFMLWRLHRSVRTKFHLCHPWWIPVKLLGEVRGFGKALGLYRRSNRRTRVNTGGNA